MSINQSIKCRVDSCKHNEGHFCSLSDILIGNDMCQNAKTTSETECRSFEM